MIAIRNLCNILPIGVKSKYYLRMLTFKDLDWYLHNCREPYYNKYLEYGRFGIIGIYSDVYPYSKM